MKSRPTTLRVLALMAIVLPLPGCVTLQQLDDFSRGVPPVRYVNLKGVGAQPLPRSVLRNKYFVNKFIRWSEVPVDEFYGQPSYSSAD